MIKDELWNGKKYKRKQCLEILITYLGCSFLWHETPQGLMYWSTVQQNLIQLLKDSEDDTNN